MRLNYYKKHSNLRHKPNSLSSENTVQHEKKFKTAKSGFWIFPVR